MFLDKLGITEVPHSDTLRQAQGVMVSLSNHEHWA